MQTAKPFIISKDKICKICGTTFNPFRTTQTVCGQRCAIIDGKQKAEEKTLKEIRKANQVKKIETQTKPQWLNALQEVFNLYIRTRDADQPCISCGTTKPVQYHAGHFYPVGSYPGLRFHEDNVHKQCGKNCNKEKHGNLHEYRLRLPERIGAERFEALTTNINRPLHLSIPEIKDLIIIYKNKTKALQHASKS